MAFNIPKLQRFFYSHYFLGGLRQTIGILLPVALIGAGFKQFDLGMIAAMGALCLAIIDQPGGPRRYRTNEMLSGVLLGTFVVAITGIASSQPLLIWLLVPALCFLLSMLAVFGKRGGLIGFACLLLMTLTMRTPLQPADVIVYTLYSFAGGAVYFCFSYFVSRLLWHRELQQTLSVALFATADYIAARSRFYDVDSDLEDSYRQLIASQSAMTEKHQAARDMVLREPPKGRKRGEQHRVRLVNVFIDMVDLLDSLVATYTDYATLRRQLPESDILVFAHDALDKLSDNVSRIALDISRNKETRRRTKVTAELRAIEYELELSRRRDFDTEQPEVYALLVQILRRLRNATRVVDRMMMHTQDAGQTQSVDERLDKSLSRFLTREEIRPGMLTSNLRLNSSHFRYALRVAIAALMGMTVTAAIARIVAEKDMAPTLLAHSYWIILTIIVIMKPGFALTRQRNGWRLAGTVIGCGLTFVLLNVTSNLQVYIAVLVITCILGQSLVQLNFMLAAIANTIFVLLTFHFLSPGTEFVIEERLFDTVIGCAIALLCSYILPWWEHSFMEPLSRTAKEANREFFRTGLRYAELARAHSGALKLPAPERTRLGAELEEASVAWRVARKNVHIAFSNFASAFYRMMDEPVARQENVPELNNLLIQNHVLASQISAAVPILATLPVVPDGVQKSLDAINEYMNGNDANPPASIETGGELATLAYPLRQMVKAAQLIRQEMRALNPPTPA